MEIASPNSPISVGRVSWPWLLGASLLLALVAWFAWGQVGQKKQVSGASTEPLLITPSQQHLGKLLQHEKKEFSFTVQNQGKEVIHILKVEFSCGCTEAKALKEVLAPGEATQILGSLNAENRVGEFGSQISVSYQANSQRDREDQGVMQLKGLVGAKAVTLINLPSNLDLGSTVLGQKPQAVTFEITKGEAEIEWDELRVVSVQSKSKVAKTSDDRWAISVLPSVKNVMRSYREDLVIELFNSKKPEVVVRQETIPLSWKVVSENFSISPSGVYLSGDRVAKVRIKSLKNRPVDVVRIGMPQDAPFKVRRLEEGGLLSLVFETFQSNDKPQNQVPWSGKIQVDLYDGLVEETYLVSAIK